MFQSEKYKQMIKLENKLNGELGDIWWSKYVSAAFWSNISTPINLAITLLSAITAGQATTENLLSQELFFKISITSLLLSTLNTFFRPHSQLMDNMSVIKVVNEFGARFETVYYSENSSEDDYIRRYNEYKKLSQDINKYQIEQTPEQQNFFTDFIYFLSKKYSCLKNSYRWLDADMIYIQEPSGSIINNFGCSGCSGYCMSKLKKNNSIKLNLIDKNEEFNLVQPMDPNIPIISKNLQFNNIDVKNIDLEKGNY